MAQTAVGDLVVNLDVNSSKFNEQITHINRQFKRTGDAANDTELRIRQAFSRQEIAAKKAGLSVGQYSNAMRMLPAQFTDIATQLAGGQSPWLILLQQGGQVKDSFGGIIPTFRALLGSVSPLMVGVGALSAATGALFYAWYQGSSTLSDFNKTLVLSGNSAGLTADRMLALARNGQSAGLTFNQTNEALTELINAGVRAGANFDDMSQAVARFTQASGVPVDKVAAAFGKLTSDPTSGLIAMAQQFHNVTAEQIAYVAQLQRAGDEAAALQAANDAATNGFNEQTKSLRDNMGTIESAADSLKRAFKSMWDAALDIGRPDTAQEMVRKAEAAFKRADEIWNLRKNDGYVNDEARARYWTDRETARLALDMAQQQAGIAKANEENASREAAAESDRQKYAAQAQSNYARTQSALEKYTARQNELNKALKEGRILQADYNINMSAAKKEYEDSLKKPPKTPAVRTQSGVRATDTGNALTLELQSQLKTLQDHKGINDTISQQRQDLWKQQSRFSVLEEASRQRALTAEEKSLLASKDEVLARAEINARLGDQIVAQQRLNTLADQAEKFSQQQAARQAGIAAQSQGLSARQAEREVALQKLREAYGTNPQALQQVLTAQQATYDAEDALRSDWLAGARQGWAEYQDAATNVFSSVQQISQSTFGGLANQLTQWQTSGKASMKEFTSSTLKMIASVINQLMVAYVIQSAMGWVGGGTKAPASGQSFAVPSYRPATFDGGGFTGHGGKYDPAGIVHRGEFVFTKESTSRIGVANLYRLMRGYATGGLVGSGNVPVPAPGGISVYAPVSISQQNAGGEVSQASTAGTARQLQGIIQQAITDRLKKEVSPGGLLYSRG